MTKKMKASKQIKYDSKQNRNGYKVNSNNINNNINNNMNYNNNNKIYNNSMISSISSSSSSGSGVRSKRNKKMKGGLVSDRPGVVPLSKSNGSSLISYSYPINHTHTLPHSYSCSSLLLLLLIIVIVDEINSLVQQQRGNSSTLPFYHLQSHQPIMYYTILYCTALLIHT